MKVLAVITEPQEMRKILRHLSRIDRSPAGDKPEHSPHKYLDCLDGYGL
jgi:hypothetical protein